MDPNKHWFYIRKFIFQALIPIVLSIFSFVDFIYQNDNDGKSYKHFYLYTFILLFIYKTTDYILLYIFSITSEEIICKKHMAAFDNNNMLQASDFLENAHVSTVIVSIKKIFKLRYCKNIIFKAIDKLCWSLGMDSPVLIPYEIVKKLGNTDLEITEENEEVVLMNTLENISTYELNIYYSHIDIKSPLLSIASPIDKSIQQMQATIFSKPGQLSV